jgi:Flp pilus assembly protein TadG
MVDMRARRSNRCAVRIVRAAGGICMARMTAAKKGFLRRLRESEGGNVLVLTAAAIFPLMGMVGGAVDMARIYAVKSRLQAACDAGALAGRRVMGTGQWTDNSGRANTIALNAFDLNFEDGAFGSQNRARSFSEAAGTVTGNASADVPMALMRLFGIPAKTIAVTCDGQMRIPNTDVMFVLDNSGSMACLVTESSCTNNAFNRSRYDSRINGLRRAVKCFYEALAKQDIDDVTPAECGTTSNPSGGLSNQVQLRIGFVNYDHLVNVGKLLPTSFFVDSATYQSREANNVTTANVWNTNGSETGQTDFNEWSPTTRSTTYNTTGYYNNFGTGTVGTGNGSYTFTVIGGSSISLVRTISGATSSNCADNNTLAGSSKTMVAVGDTAGSTNSSTGSWSAPVYPGSDSRSRTYTDTRTNTAIGFRYRWFAVGGTNRCRLESATGKASTQWSQTRTATGTQPIVWSTVTRADDWTYQPRTIDVSALKNGAEWNNSFTIPNLAHANGNYNLSGANSSTYLLTPGSMTVTWDGCIEERDTVANTDGNPSDDWNSYPTSPANAYDMDIDLVPSNNATRWKPALDQVIWARRSGSTNTTDPVTTTSDLSQNLGFHDCGVTPSRLLTQYSGATGASNIRDYINTLVPNGNTYHDIGLLWGARLMSPTGIFASDNATTPGGAQIQRHMIFMTDGDTANTYNNYASYGIEWWDRRQVSPSGLTNSQYQDKLEANNNARAAALCTAIKNKGITLWVISYGSGVSGSTVTRLRNCATSSAYFFQASNATALITQFRTIADKISQLRLTN